MLKVNINPHPKKGKKPKYKIVSTGSICATVAEIALLVYSIHAGLKKKDPDAAQQFRVTMQAILTDPDTPVWEDQSRHHQGTPK